MIWYGMMYDMIYLTAVGLTPGGSSKVHIYTHHTQNTEKGIYITIKKLNTHNN
jgi:hypothetical protein